MLVFTHVCAIIFGIVFILLAAQDGFETVVLPRRVEHKLRFARLFYQTSWTLWSWFARKMKSGNRREQYLSYYGPLSLILLLALWATGFIIGFALIIWGHQAPVNAPEKTVSFLSYVYFSGTTFVTLGLGDITPLDAWGRLIVVIEAGSGLAFLALIISYLPIIYQAFSRREVSIALLDARAGSPPTATELLRRHAHSNYPDELMLFMREYERWCAEILESHLSYPVLTYYRSQHERQSWLRALSVVLDACALAIVGIEGLPIKPMKFTFAIARHAVVDLAQTYGTPPLANPKRCSSEKFKRLKTELTEAGLFFTDEATAEQRLAEIRGMYEPFLESLADHLLMPLSEFVPSSERVDDWQTSAWDHFLEATPRTLDRAIRQE